MLLIGTATIPALKSLSSKPRSVSWSIRAGDECQIDQQVPWPRADLNQATLVGYGTLEPDDAHNYRIPLPEALQGLTDPRSLAITLAWLTPVKPGHQSYRTVKLEAAPASPKEAFGVERHKDQPIDQAVKKGTVFHERFVGKRAVPFIDHGHLNVGVWCKDDAGNDGAPVRYAIVVTIEAGTPLRIYEQVRERLRVRPRPPA